MRFPAAFRTSCLQAIARAPLPLGLSCPLVGSRGAVAAQHLAALPAREAHEIALGAAVGEPHVRVCVAEQMGVKLLDTRLGPTATQYLENAARAKRSLRGEPKLVEIRVW